MTERFSPEPGSDAPTYDRLQDMLVARLPGFSRRTLAIALSALPIVALLNVGVLVWSMGGIDFSRQTDAPGLLAVAAILAFVPMLTNSLRLANWGRFLGVKLGFGGALRVMTGMMIANSITPSATGGMPIKLLFLMNEQVDSHRAVTLISFQTAEDMLVIFGMVGACLSISGFALVDFVQSDPTLLARLDAALHTAGLIAFVVMILVVLVSLAIAKGWMGRRVYDRTAGWARFLRSSISRVLGDWMAVAKRGKGIAFMNIALALLQWSARFSIAGLVLAAFSVEWRPALFWLLQYLVQAISSIVPTPGGMGGAEAGFLLLFAPFAQVGTLIPAMSIWRLIFFYAPLIGAAFAYLFLRRKKRPWQKTSTIDFSLKPQQPAE